MPNSRVVIGSRGSALALWQTGHIVERLRAIVPHLEVVAETIVVYDSLANPVRLAHARPEAKLIYVGKKAGSHASSQEEINALLVEQSLAGLRVARLKGGDPFVLGRGGEEALALVGAGHLFNPQPR